MFINNIVLFPSRLGQLKKGVEIFPEILSRSEYLNSYKNIIKVNCTNNLYKNLNLLNIENKNILNKNESLINIGGDHSMAIATVSASLNKFEQLKLIWIDAHPDINTFHKSKSKNFHGMPLAFLSGLDQSEKISFIKNHIKFNNILYIGIRDIDDYEKYIIHKNNIKYILSNDINNNINHSLNIISNFIGDHPFHVSFDVDSIDPYFIPSTGTPVPNGIYPEKAKLLLDKIIFDRFGNLKNNFVNMDITELNLFIGNHKEQMTSYNCVNNVISNVLK